MKTNSISALFSYIFLVLMVQTSRSSGSIKNGNSRLKSTSSGSSSRKKVFKQTRSKALILVIKQNEI